MNCWGLFNQKNKLIFSTIYEENFDLNLHRQMRAERDQSKQLKSLREATSPWNQLQLDKKYVGCLVSAGSISPRAFLYQQLSRCCRFDGTFDKKFFHEGGRIQAVARKL